jgi:hypothetical protein
MVVLMRRLSMPVVLAVALWTAASTSTIAWGGQAHRLVARVAAGRLTPAASRSVRSLLDGASLVDVSSWADQEEDRDPQTAPWHYVNIPADAASYARERDCPTSNARGRGSRPGDWRNCVVDRILYTEERVGNRALARAERAVALKFLVHLVGDVHQPFHTIDVARGGNRIDVVAFGSTNCAPRGASPFACNLHGVWDSTLVLHRRLNDDRYVAELEREIARHGWSAGSSAPADWANESHAIARSATLPAGGRVDETYFRAQLPAIDERLARAGLRLAAVLNRLLG